MLSWFYDAAKVVIRKLIERERAKPNCGVFPVAIMWANVFSECCECHDAAYVELRMKAINLAKAGKVTIEQFSDWVEIFKLQHRHIDRQFFRCVEEVAGSNVFYMYVGQLFIEIVEDLGWDVWKSTTIKTYELLHSSEYYST